VVHGIGGGRQRLRQNTSIPGEQKAAAIMNMNMKMAIGNALTGPMLLIIRVVSGALS
jgi:hypothetical protein